MKKYLITLSLLFTLLTSQAQDTWSIGLQSSVYSTGIENQNPYDKEKLPAINSNRPAYALIVARSLNNGFSLSLEPAYVQLGQSYDDITDLGNYMRNISTSYIQTPLMLSKEFGENKLRINVKGGFYGAYLVKSVFEESTLISEGSLIGPTLIEENSDRFKSFDFGTKVNLGSKLYVSESLALSLDYGIMMGFSDINTADYKYEAEYKLDYKKSRHFSYGLNLGLHYSF